jgi:hypothetical protein
MVINDEKTNNALQLILNSSIVTDEVKELLRDTSFLEQNDGIIINLARLIFLADSISIGNNEIVVRKSVTKQQEPKIDIENIIYRYLLKIKHDTIIDADISKLNELKQYKSYQKLYQLLNLAMDQKTKVKKVPNDNGLKMTLANLEMFLNND